jgi:hypothetical protein
MNTIDDIVIDIAKYPALVTGLLLLVLGRQIKMSFIPNSLIPITLAVIGGVVFPLLSKDLAASKIYTIVIGCLLGFTTTGLHQALCRMPVLKDNPIFKALLNPDENDSTPNSDRS